MAAQGLDSHFWIQGFRGRLSVAGFGVDRTRIRFGWEGSSEVCFLVLGVSVAWLLFAVASAAASAIASEAVCHGQQARKHCCCLLLKGCSKTEFAK